MGKAISALKRGSGLPALKSSLLFKQHRPSILQPLLQRSSNDRGCQCSVPLSRQRPWITSASHAISFQDWPGVALGTLLMLNAAQCCMLV